MHAPASAAPPRRSAPSTASVVAVRLVAVRLVAVTSPSVCVPSLELLTATASSAAWLASSVDTLAAIASSDDDSGVPWTTTSPATVKFPLALRPPSASRERHASAFLPTQIFPASDPTQSDAPSRFAVAAAPRSAPDPVVVAPPSAGSGVAGGGTVQVWVQVHPNHPLALCRLLPHSLQSPCVMG